MLLTKSDEFSSRVTWCSRGMPLFVCRLVRGVKCSQRSCTIADGLHTTARWRRSPSTGPLAGIRVLELGSFIAGPFAGQLLGDYGADVIKVEAPDGGDPMRRWGVTHDGDGLWWPSIGRNKRSVVADLRTAEGRELRRPRSPERRRRARELPARTPRRLRPRLRHPQRGQPRRGARARVRVRADRPARRGGRLRLDRRGRRRHPPHHRRPRPPAGPMRHQPRRQRSPSMFAVVGTLAALHERGDQRQGPGGRRGDLRGGRRADGVDDGRLRGRRRRARPQRRHAAGRRAGQRLPDRATAARSSSPATPTACSPGCAPSWASPSWRRTRATRPTPPAARTRWTSTAASREWTGTLDADGPARSAGGARRPGRARLHRARHAQRPALPRPGDGPPRHGPRRLRPSDHGHRPQVQPYPGRRARRRPHARASTPPRSPPRWSGRIK